MDEHGAQLKKRHVQGAPSSPNQHLGTAAEEALAGDSMPTVPLQQPQLSSGEQQRHQQGSKTADSPLTSKHVLVPVDFAWNVLLVMPLVLWLALTMLGIRHFRDLPKKRWEVDHWMQWFDAIFRAGGPMLPLLPLALRWPALDLREWPKALQPFYRPANRVQYQSHGSKAVTGVGNGASAGPTAGSFRATKLASATLPWTCVAVYFTVATVRALLYLVHVAAQQWQYAAHAHAHPSTAFAPGFDNVSRLDNMTPADSDVSTLVNMSMTPIVPARLLNGWLSDHIFLAASVLACLQVELLCSVSDCVKLDEEGAGMARIFLARSALLWSIALITLVCIDMYFTSRYFHFPSESAMGVLLGLLLFQGPALAWLMYQRRKA